MRWIALLALFGIFSLAGCSNDSQQEVLPSPTLVEESTSTVVSFAVESEEVTEDTPGPPATADVSDPNNMVENRPANANVLFVKANLAADSSWTFTVTVEHPDTGWEDYADGWDVVLPDGEVIKPDPESPFTRLLLHPHETEQPFTRSQSGINIPPDIDRVTVRAHDFVDGFGGKEVVVDLSVASGADFEVGR